MSWQPYRNGNAYQKEVLFIDTCHAEESKENP